MKWILQKNLYTEEDDFKIIKEIFEKFSISYIEVDVCNGKLIPDPDIIDKDDIMILGGYSLMRYAKNNNLQPGCYVDNMNMEAWISNYGDNMLNYDSKIIKISEVDEPGYFFVRPEKDSKEFSGKTFNNQEDFNQFREDLISTSAICDENTVVIVSSVKCIHREVRFFIVNGKIVSASVYKINGQMRTSPIINDDEIDFVNNMISLYQPTKAFVMDIAYTDEGLKIVELNCINCSGFYEANIQKIIMELNYIEDGE